MQARNCAREENAMQLLCKKPGLVTLNVDVACDLRWESFGSRSESRDCAAIFRVYFKVDMLAANGCVLCTEALHGGSQAPSAACMQRNTCDGYSGGGACRCTLVGKYAVCIPMLLCCFACRIWAPMSRDVDDRDEKKP